MSEEYEAGGPAWPEYATTKIAVWWDMKDCPIPEGYDARRVRPSIEGAFKKRGYYGPVSITAYGDQTQTPGHVLRGLFSTGVAVAHNISESTCPRMYSDMVEWRGHNPPPATMMIISNQVEAVFSWDLVRLQQRTPYNLFLAYSIRSEYSSVLFASVEWLWEKLLRSADNNKIETRSSETSAMLHCKSCNFDAQSPQKFRKHLSSYNHARDEAINPRYTKLISVTEKWARNYPATPECATAKIQVWWDMKDCPIPEGYDARRVRPSLEAAFKNLGYSGPVSITAYGDLKHTPDHILRALSSTGVDVAHTIAYVTYRRMCSDIREWSRDNPHPATVMFISDSVEYFSKTLLVDLQQLEKRNLFMAYSFRPRNMSTLLTSAEWLWESLLAVSETKRHVLQKCSTVSETRRHVLQKCSESERGESTGVFYCKLCFCDCKSLDNFRTHLSSEEHARKENGITASAQRREQVQKLSRLFHFEDKHWHWRKVEKSKRMRRKAFRKGFRLLDNYLRLTNRGARRRARLTNRGARRRARKS